jgi:hypothetical protein
VRGWSCPVEGVRVGRSKPVALSCDRRGDERPDPRNGSQTLADRVVLAPCENLPLKTSDLCLGMFDVANDYLQNLTGNIRYRRAIAGFATHTASLASRNFPPGHTGGIFADVFAP